MSDKFKQPKIRKARYHRLTLKTGHILEIGWHFGRQQYVVCVYHPDKYKDPNVWNAETRLFGHTPREVLSGARLDIAEELDPNVRKVRERLEGKNPEKGYLRFKARAYASAISASEEYRKAFDDYDKTRRVRGKFK